ncbi:MAG: N-acetyltransferase [Pseudomonadota bacterium]|nr:N-acetyltransferase [Pseudomonadota bacterium]
MKMNDSIFIRKEQEIDNTEINTLYTNSFGPGRYAKSAFRYREKYDHLIDISQVLICQNKLIGSVRFWNILVNNKKSLLLGPIVMHRDYRGQGFGKRLLKDSILNCKNLGHNLIILVGDLSYYSKVGFKRIGQRKILFEGPVNYERVLYIEFNKSIIEHSADIKINKFID